LAACVAKSKEALFSPVSLRLLQLMGAMLFTGLARACSITSSQWSQLVKLVSYTAGRRILCQWWHSDDASNSFLFCPPIRRRIQGADGSWGPTGPKCVKF